jgi:heterodisulfide reductase subunit B2
MKYSYYPGCSLESTGISYDMSTREVCKALGIELEELEDWNCCGSTAYFAIDELLCLCFSGRNLALAEQQGGDLVAPCSACYTVLRKTNRYLNDYPDVKSKVDEALAAGGMKYSGKTRVRHLAEVLLTDVGLKAISEKVQRNLHGLKVATYYGCQLVRPEVGFDHPEFPQSLQSLVEALGGEATKFPLMSRCCGGALILSEESVALGVMNKLLRSATDGGAQVMIAACPLCHLNLDAFQGKVNSKYGTSYHLPVLYFTQLVGLALGIEPKALGIEKNIIPATELLAAYA